MLCCSALHATRRHQLTDLPAKLLLHFRSKQNKLLLSGEPGISASVHELAPVTSRSDKINMATAPGSRWIWIVSSPHEYRAAGSSIQKETINDS